MIIYRLFLFCCNYLVLFVLILMVKDYLCDNVAVNRSCYIKVVWKYFSILKHVHFEL